MGYFRNRKAFIGSMNIYDNSSDNYDELCSARDLADAADEMELERLDNESYGNSAEDF